MHCGGNRRQRRVAGAECYEQGVGVAEPQLPGNVLGRNIAYVQARHLAFEHLTPLAFVLLLVSLAEPASDFGAAPGCGKVTELRAQPVATRLRFFARDDFDAVAVLYLVGQRHDAAVDFCAAATMPDLGVDVIGEVERRGVRRHLDDVAFRADRVDAILENVAANLVKKIAIAIGRFE